MVIFNNKW